MYGGRHKYSLICSTITYYLFFGILSRVSLDANSPLDQPHVHRELRFVQVNECLPRPGSGRVHGGVPYKRRMLHCPSGAVLHIQQAHVGQTFSSDSNCLFYENSAMTENTHTEEFWRMQPIDPSDRKMCSPKSIKPLIQSLCHGLNTCDVVSKLSGQEEASQCPHRRSLDVNYTCLPAYSQPELICADSYVELTCTAFGPDSNMLILNAKLLHNLSALSDSPDAAKKNLCTKPETTDYCNEVDVTSFYADMCNRRTLCTINPNMAPQNKFSVESPSSNIFASGSSELILSKPQCTKFHLYLEYTCASDILLKPIRTLDTTGSRRKNERRTKKRERQDHLEHEEIYSTVASGMSVTLMSSMPDTASNNIAKINSIRKQTTSPEESGINQHKSLATNEAQSSESNRVILISLIPSVICVLLVLLLIAYTIRHRHPKQLRAMKRNLPFCRDTASSGFNKLDSADSQTLLPSDCCLVSHEMMRVGCTIPEHLSTNPMYQTHSTAGAHTWNQVSLPHASAGSISVAGSSCCSCSPKFPGSHCPGSISPGGARNQCHNLETTVAGKGFAATASSRIGPDPTLCDLARSSCANEPPPGPASGNKYDKAGESNDEISKRYLPSSTHPSFSLSNAGAQKMEPSRKDNFVYLDMDTSQMAGGLNQPNVKLSHSSPSPSESRSKCNHTMPQMTDSKCEVYNSFMQPKVAHALAQHSRNLITPCKQLNVNYQSRLAPPLFNQIEQHGSGYCNSFSTEFESALHDRRKTHTIPVVRYPHDLDDAEESGEDAHSENESQHSSTENVTTITQVSNNRPDLCPPVKSEMRAFKSMDTEICCDATHRTEPFTKNRLNIESINKIESSCTADRLDRSSPIRVVAPHNSSLQSASSGSPARVARCQEGKMTKTLRFQAPFDENQFPVYGSQISRQNSVHMTSSICHSMQP